VAAKQLAEESHVFVADLFADFLHRAVHVFELALGGVDAQPVQVGEFLRVTVSV